MSSIHYSNKKRPKVLPNGRMVLSADCDLRRPNMYYVSYAINYAAFAVVLGLIRNTASAGIRIRDPNIFQINMNVSNIPMSA
jgi:hypothetical protein